MLLALLFLVPRAGSQEKPEKKDSEGRLGTHFESAQRAQSQGDFTRAEVEFKQFVADALQRLAGRRAAAGEEKKSVELLESALELAPNDANLRLNYAKACRASGDLQEAKAAAENLITVAPRNTEAQLEMARILSQMGDDAGATAHFERAVALEPSLENGMALANEYLKRKNPDSAAKIFKEMLASFGDSPELRLEFGSAYATAGFAERGIPEFEKALAMNEKIRGGHYSLGAAYVSGLGNVLQDRAETEFRKELANYPDDPFSLYQLGSIELGRHDQAAAEKDLAKAVKLDPQNPDPYILLGQLYLDMERPKEAEAALRNCISLTAHVERNHFQVQRAHYLLAHILMESGRSDEAKAEMKIANDLLKRNTLSMQGVTEPSPAESANAAGKSSAPDPGKQREADKFEQKIKGPVADSYNNLGAIEASANKLPAALRYFQMAAKWNPSLEGLDYNWGRAAFFSGDYRQARGPLERYLSLHSEDTWVRSALGSAQFSLQDYPEAVKTLQPMERLLGDKPQLSYIYAVSLLKSGRTDAAVERLEALEKANPEIALIPETLSGAYASKGETEKAAQQKEIARELRARETSQKYPTPN